MKTLVTGGTGFTGSHLVRQLLSEGREVRVLDYQKGLFYDELEKLGAEIRLGSVADRTVVDQAVAGCDTVYHLAAAFRELKATKQHYWDVNVEGTRHVGEACLQHGVQKLVYCSTQGVHGHIANPPGDENSPIAPEDYYQYTKYEGERALQDSIDQGLDVTTIRPTAIYGPGDPARFLMLYKMAARGRFLMFGRGATYYHPVHIGNLVDAFLLAAAPSQGASGAAYLIGDEHYWSLNELVELVAKSMDCKVRIVHLPFWPLYGAAGVCEAVCRPLGIAPPLFRRRVNWFRQDRAFSVDKARRELGYEPRVGIEEGLAETAHWYREHGYL